MIIVLNVIQVIFYMDFNVLKIVLMDILMIKIIIIVNCVMMNVKIVIKMDAWAVIKILKFHYYIKGLV